MRKLTREQKRDTAAIAAKRDADIDFSDVPEVVDWSGAEIGKFYRPPKKAVTMRLDQDVLDWLKAYGKGYQTKVNLLLRHAMASAGANSRSGAGRAQRKRSRRSQAMG
ncbi:MAG: BrnA antitoxin family protein [Terriglobales bacterium]